MTSFVAAAPSALRSGTSRQGVSFLALLKARISLARQRRALSRLDAHQLRDIGLDVEAAAAEAARPVWDAPIGWR